MEDREANIDVIEDVIKEELTRLGLQPRQIEGCIDVGYETLHIIRCGLQILDLSETQEHLAAVELNANIKNPDIGDFVISDLTIARGKTPEAAMEEATRNYLKVTFPAIQALFDEKVAAQIQENAKIRNVESYTPNANQFVKWRVLTGELQILNDSDGGLADYLANKSPLLMFFDTITGYFSDAHLHWCKFYITKKDDELIVGCSIDGEVSEEAKAEIYEKFEYDGRSDFEIRQFFVFQPLRFMEEGEEGTKELIDYNRKIEATGTEPEPEKSWWKFWQ